MPHARKGWSASLRLVIPRQGARCPWPSGAIPRARGGEPYKEGRAFGKDPSALDLSPARGKVKSKGKDQSLLARYACPRFLDTVL